MHLLIEKCFQLSHTFKVLTLNLSSKILKKLFAYYKDIQQILHEKGFLVKLSYYNCCKYQQSFDDK